MVWYGLEPVAGDSPEWALELASAAKLPRILTNSVRRVAALGTPGSLELIVDALGRTGEDADRLAILRAIAQSLQGRRTVAMPANWPTAFQKLRGSDDREVVSQATRLAATFGDPTALEALREVLALSDRPMAERVDALASLLKARDPGLAPVLRRLLAEPELRAQALRALASYDDPETAPAVLALYPSLAPEDRRDALNTLAARASSSKALLAAVEAGKVAAKDLSADLVRQLRNHKDAEVDALIGKVWGAARETTADKAKLIEKYRGMLTAGYAKRPDLELGRAVFARTCQQCHTLFGAGSNIGPDLTGSNRADREYVLSNVVDPSSLIGNDYLAHVVATADGRVLTGLIKAEDKDAVTLQTANELLVIPQDDIDERRPSDLSMMPDDLLTPLSEIEVRSLVAYLASPAQVPVLATPENVAGFFNGNDLTGWVGEEGLWTVEDGEIVGKTPGLDHNSFLKSELSVGDFRLTVKVKLVRNEGNSGVQFHSEALPDGEMKGPQADIGADWWGKLYEEGGRGLLWPKSAEEHVRDGEWNDYEIVAVGPSIRTFINGKPAVVLDDPEVSRRGIFGLQLHSGGATEVRYKDLKLELDPKLEAKAAP
jgi:putative heme-binding domain-containing protein